MSLERFHQAQDGGFAGYATALEEIRRGRKRSHWIWYVFPQLDGLGSSSTARQYAIRDLDEAGEYLRDPVLRNRYEEITAAVKKRLAARSTVEDLMGGDTDALKLASSLTLFREAARRGARLESDSDCTRLAQLCEQVLELTAAQGFGPCAFTIERCAKS
jgi:uncharacterized protein (DUF1810 family)